MSQKVTATTPVGRIVAGSLYKPQTTNAQGAPLVYKTGANAGQPRELYWFHLAVKKNPGETHWANTEIGKLIWGVGHAAHPAVAQYPGYSWKVSDGDDTTPNPKSKPPGKRACDQEGYPGHWIFKFAGSYAPKVYVIENGGFVQHLEPDYIKPGYFAEVFFSCEGNGASESPGVYLNPSMVCFRAFGPEINFGASPDQAGFGQTALPAGASTVPPPAGTPAPPPATGAAPSPLPPGGSAPTPQPPAPAAPAGVPVVPNPGFIQMPLPGGVPAPAAPAAPAPPPAAPAAPSGPRMTAAANGVPYANYIAQGWTDALLVQHGYMLA